VFGSARVARNAGSALARRLTSTSVSATTANTTGSFADCLKEVPVPGLEVYCLHLGGAVSDFDEDATAYSGRAGAFYWISQGVWDRPEDDEPAIGWCRQTARRLAERSLAANYVNEQADTGIARTAYGDGKYARLGALKWRHDPTNLFRLNQNIEPAPPARDASS